MSSYFSGLILIVIVLFPAAIRLYVPKIYSNYRMKDPLSVLPIFSIIISLVMFFVYDFKYETLIAFCLSVFCFICNIAQIYNFCIGLQRVSFSPFFKVLGIIQTVFIISFTVTIIYFSPPLITNKNSTKIIFYGNEKKGFFVKNTIFEKTSAKLEIYKPYENIHELYTPPEEYLAQDRQTISELVTKTKEINISVEEKRNTYGDFLKLEEIDKSNVRKQKRREEKERRQAEKFARKKLQKKISKYVPEEKSYPSVIFVSDIFVDNDDCDGILTYLAERGYEVYSLKYYDKKLTFFGNILDSKIFLTQNLRKQNMMNSDKLIENYDNFVDFNKNKYLKSLVLMESIEKLPAYIIADGYCIPAALKIKEEYPDKILGVYEINKHDKIVNYYDGYGDFQAKYPLDASFLQLPKQKNWDNAKRIAFYADKYFRTKK
ncbi:MAG: hypothetical protein ACTTHG_04165 [Treponemataceae bacterium]